MKALIFLLSCTLAFFCLHFTLPLAAQGYETQDDQIVEETLEIINEEANPPAEAPYVDYEVEVESDNKKKETDRRQRRTQRRQAINNQKRVSSPKGEGRVGRRYIKHPSAKRGLYKITKEGTYLYRVQTSERKGTAAVKFSVFSAPNFVNGDNGATYNDVYGGNDVIAFFDYEWDLDFMPNLTLKAGSGLHIASGNGRLSSGEESKEEFTLLMLPNNVGLVYKFKFGKKPWFYPYVEGGAGAFVFTERRDDNEPPLGRWGAAFNVHAIGGLAFNITALNREAALRIDAEHGINDIYFTIDIRQTIGFGSFDTTSTLFNGGISVEF